MHHSPVYITAKFC